MEEQSGFALMLRPAGPAGFSAAAVGRPAVSETYAFEYGGPFGFRRGSKSIRLRSDGPGCECHAAWANR